MDNIEIKAGEIIELVSDSKFELAHFGVFIALKDFDLTKVSDSFRAGQDGAFDSWLVKQGYVASKKTRYIDIDEDCSELELSEENRDYG